MPVIQNHLRSPGRRLVAGEERLESDGEQATAREKCGTRMWTCLWRGHPYWVTSPLFLKNKRHMLCIPIVTVRNGVQFS